MICNRLLIHFIFYKNLAERCVHLTAGTKRYASRIIQPATTVFCCVAFCVELILSPKLNAMPYSMD